MSLCMYLNIVIIANDLIYRAVRPYFVFEAHDEFLYITVRAALNYVPLGAVVYA